MHLSINTREVDNGWILDAEVNIAPSGNPSPGSVETHEVYGRWEEVKERVKVLLEGIIEDYKETISEKYRNPVVE